MLGVRQGFPTKNVSTFRKPTFKHTLATPALTFQFSNIFISTEFTEEEEKWRSVEKAVFKNNVTFLQGPGNK